MNFYDQNFFDNNLFLTQTRNLPGRGPYYHRILYLFDPQNRVEPSQRPRNTPPTDELQNCVDSFQRLSPNLPIETRISLLPEISLKLITNSNGIITPNVKSLRGKAFHWIYPRTFGLQG